MKSKEKNYRLPNKLKVILTENKKSPVVSIQMWVKTGSIHEKSGQEGISHFIEHLLFKGTRKFAVGEIAARVEASGGQINAYTSFDQTVFHITISSHYVDVGLELIAEMMGFPNFESEEIDRERGVVIEEIKKSEDDPNRWLSRELFSCVYGKNPYGTPIIGYADNIENMQRKDIVKYFSSRYVPENMFLLVTGDFTNSEMQKKVSQYFSEIPKNELKKVKVVDLNKQKKARIRIKKSKFKMAQFHIVWPIPRATHPDIPILDVLAASFGQGESSPLTKRLRLSRPLTQYAVTSTFTQKTNGLFTFSSALNIENLNEVLCELNLSFTELFLKGIGGEDLNRAIRNIESEELYNLETVDGLAKKIGYLEHLTGDQEFFEKYLERIRQVTPKDLARVSHKYLHPDKVNFVLAAPDTELDVDKAVKAWHKNYKKLYPGAKKTKKTLASEKKSSSLKWKISRNQGQPKFDHFKLNKTIPVVLWPSKDTPVVSVRAGFLGGSKIESEGALGLTELLSRCWSASTKSKSETELNWNIEKLASSIGSFGGRNSAGVSMETLAPVADKAVDIWAEVLNTPSFPEEIVEREKSIMIDQIKSKQDSPAYLAMQAFSEKMFAGHPYSRDLLGTIESVKELSRDDLFNHWQQMYSKENLTLSAAGFFDSEKLCIKLENLLDCLPKGETRGKKFDHEGPIQDVKTFHKLDKEQTHLIIGVRGLDYLDQGKYALHTIQSILAGQGGRLFVNLREKNSLAYSVSPVYLEGMDTGYFGAYIACSPDKAVKALDLLRKEFVELADQGVSSSELERSKRYLIGRHDIDLQRNSSIASAMLFDEMYGAGGEQVFSFADRIESVSCDELNEVAAKLLKQPLVISAVGSKCPW